MPKRIWKIDKFHGGLNSNADPRDIEDNELSRASDIMVDLMGKIRPMGGMAAHYNYVNSASTGTAAGAVTAGYGLFPFSHDRLGAQSTGTSQAETGDDYLVFADCDSSANFDIYSKVANAWGDGIVDLGSTALMKPTFYYVDGALRVSDGNFGANNTPKWYGYVERTLFPGVSGDEIANDGWYAKDQGLAKPPACDLDDDSTNSAPAAGEVDINFFDISAAGGTWDLVSYDGLRCYISFVYDGDVGDRTGQESLLREMTGTHPTVPADYMMKLRIMAHGPFNERITGGRVYWSEIIDQDTSPYEIDGTRYLLAEFDFNRGSRPAGDNQWIKWDEAAVSGDVETPDGTFHQILHPPMDETYESINGFSHNYDSISFDADGYGFKTAVVANRVVYAGNVRMKNKDGIVETRADAMFKSLVGKFDTFVPDRLIEASIRDGDEIVKLEEYADRILQFKKKKMHLINVSQEIEFLEDTFMHKGVTHPAATCKTDYGIAWVNRHGVYLYDGRRVNNLLEKDGRQIIKDIIWDDWITAAGGYPMIGYVPKKRQLIVIADIGASGGDNDIYLHDLVTRSWVHGYNRVPAGDVAKTNPITDWNGDFVIGHTTGTIVKWVDDLADAGTTTDDMVYIYTKDIDFGQPAQRKKVYRVRISYKGDADGLYVRYGVNGETDTFRTFEDTELSGGIATPDGSSDTTPLEDATDLTHWTHAELKPSTASQADNIYSFRIVMSGTIDNDFRINDISIVYRLKPPK